MTSNAKVAEPPSYPSLSSPSPLFSYKREILLKVLAYFVQYDFFVDDEIIFLTDHITTIIDYFHITTREYTIFLSPADYRLVRHRNGASDVGEKPSGCFSFWGWECVPKRSHQEVSLREELERYNVAIVSTDRMKSLLYFVGLINRFYRRYPENDLIAKCFVEISKILYRETGHSSYNEYHLLYEFKPKEYSFYENQILPNILYKKIRLSKMIQFISLEHYAHKKCEYMLRSFSQIAEELGAIRIKIKYNYDHQREKNREVVIGPSRGGIGFKRTQRESEGNNLNFNFAYSNNNYINLNEYFLNDKILNENKFLLCKEDYESNIELKYLISARCKNLIEKYYTQFKHQTMNNVEMRIYTLLKEFDLEFQWNEFKREMIEITLQIDFLNILEDKKLIDGGNIYPLKEGYIYLKNILERSDSEPILSSDPEPFAESPSPSIKFVKYINFLKAHLYCIQNGHIYLAYDYAYKKDVMKIYHQVIVMNFTEDEFIKYIENYWINQREWYHFIMLRDVLLKGSDNICDKFHFTTFQYMNIFHRKYHLLEMMEEQLKKTVPGLIHQQITEAIARFARNEYTYQDMIDYNSDDEKKMDQIKHQERIHPKKKQINGAAAAQEKVPVENLPEKLCEQIAHHRQKEMQQRANVTVVDIFANALNGYVWIDDDDDRPSSQEVPEERQERQERQKREEKSVMVCTLYKQYNDLCKGGNSMMQQFDSNLFKTHLEKSGFHSRVIELVIKGAKGTFYYANGISDNVDNVHRLEEIMMSVITYYYRDTIQVLQESCIQKLVHIEKYKMVDVMKLIQEVVKAISKWYIHKYKYVYNAGSQESKGNPIRNVMGSVTGMYDSLQKHADHDHSSPIQIPGTGPGTRRNSYESNGGSGAGGSGSTQSSPIQPIANANLKQAVPPLPLLPIDSEMEEEEEDGKRKIKKLSLIDECETIFVKFIIKHIHTNDDDKEPTYIKIEKRVLITEEKIREMVREEISKEKSFINYRKHRLYFTYENLLKVVAKIKEAYPD